LTIALTSLVAVLVVVGFHYEFLRAISAVLARLPGPHRVRVALGIVMAIAAHLVEVVIFAVGWWWCIRDGSAVLSIAGPDARDLLYFSGSIYTSLGFGDIVPVAEGRALTIVEAVTGLVLIAWTASFTYFEMRMNWPGDRRETS
jgi:hypothetical protein